MAQVRDETSRQDAAIAALFADASRPPLGDERFVTGVMERVGAEQAQAKVRWTVALVAVGALTAGTVATHFGTVAGALADAYAGYAGQAAMGAGGSALLIAAAAAVCGWLYTERG
jgi:hypothetical protein